MYLIRIEGWASGEACPHEGWFVESGNHDAAGGRGYFDFAPDPRRAMQFATSGEALEFWKRQSRVKPLRPDGKPNRPLTAASITILSMKDALC